MEDDMDVGEEGSIGNEGVWQERRSEYRKRK